METIGIFYGSSTGNTEDAAKQIQSEFGDNSVKIFDTSETKATELSDFSNIILGTSTWGAGDIQDDFEAFIDDIDSMDLSGKNIALFGMGDQYGHGDTYVDALAEVYSKVIEKGATVIGETSSEGYDHDNSEAENDGKFVGLALDEDNQSELTNERITNWVTDLKSKFA
jgi:flavodoxin I